MTLRTPGKSWLNRALAKMRSMLGLSVLKPARRPKLPRTHGDYDAMVTAEIKRRRKNAKRLHNQKKGNTK